MILQNTEHRTQNTEHRTQNTEHGTRNTEHGTRNTEHGTRNTEHRTQNTEHGTRNTERRTRKNMRLDNSIIEFFKQRIIQILPDATLYLFGSRTLDDGRGGDIDLLILTKKPVDKKLFRPIRVDFYKKFGWQKIDLVNFTYEDNSVFKRIIQTNAIEL